MIDTYTKAILTVIAMALIAIVAQNSLRPASAEGGVMRAVICDLDNHCTKLINAGPTNAPVYVLPTAPSVGR